MRKAVFLDMDGTINFDFGYVYKKEDLKFMPRTIPALGKIQAMGFLLLIITNQSGIGRKYCNMSDYEGFTQYMLGLLDKKGVKIHAVYVCPHLPESNCLCRKPNIGNYKKAIKKFNINTPQSYVIGDKTEDIKAGELIGARTILVKTGKGGTDGKYNATPNYIAEDLYEATRWIQKKEKACQ